MLLNGGQSLVEQILQGVVIRAYDEGSAPEVRLPVSNGLHEAD
jgi:hypothetical protein